MKGLCVFLTTLAALTYSKPQLSFGSSSEEAETRLGLLASNLGLSPTGETDPRTGSFTELDLPSDLPSGRVPGAPSVGSVGPAAPAYPGEECCCIPADQQCFDLLPVDDLVGEGLIDPRIVNRPPAQPSQLNTLDTCPAGYKTCCYAPDLGLDLSTFQRNSGCISPLAATTHGHLHTAQSSWSQGCTEPAVYGAKQCGTRSYSGPVPGLQHGQTSPGEFPWTCILLNQNNDFIGTCTVIPDDFNNNNGRPTRKILTAAHKLKNIQRNE